MKKAIRTRMLLSVLILASAPVFLSCASAPATSRESQPTFIKSEGPYYIGDRGPAGGWIIYDKGNNSEGWRYMEAAPVDQTPDSWRHAGLAEWGCHGKAIPGARNTAIGKGMLNTKAILDGCDEPDTAARMCADYRGGGKDDWFLPTKDELELIFTHLFKQRIGGLRLGEYWSSTETTNGRHAWHHNFTNEKQLYCNKYPNYRVRCVRVFKGKEGEEGVKSDARAAGEAVAARTEGPVVARADSGMTKEDECNNYQRISRLAADVRQEKIRELLDYMDRNGIKYYNYLDFNQHYIHINLNGMLVSSDRVIGTSTSHSLTVPVRFSSSLPSHELGAYIFGTTQGKAFLENCIFDITGHVFSGLMTRGDQQEGVATQYHIHTSLATMGHPFTQLRPYQDSRVAAQKTWVVPLRDSLGQVSQEKRDHVIRLIEQLNMR
ncbi:MAG: DUF1566 domain-containing protein [Deltaproteobacteria bacterium]|nr:DUF1566 domain-containing protein [Deltaproteobacteria bacterium]